MKSLGAFIFICIVPSPNWCVPAGQNEADISSFQVESKSGVSVEADIDQDDKIMPNIGYLLRGYDIMTGNPLDVDTGLPVDPGFREPIFKAEYNSHRMTPDQRYLQPDGTSIQDCSGTCKISFSTTKISGAKSYQKSLENIVSASVGGNYGVYGAKFSASASFKDVQTRTSSQSSLFTQSSASCCSYWAQTLTYDPPPPSNDFIKAIGYLSNDYDETAYFRFIQTFGTHFIKKVQLGALFGQQSEISREDWKTMVENGQTISVGAEVSASMVAYGASASSEYTNDQQKEEAEEFESKSKNQKIFTIGVAPPADMKASTWISETKSAPAPMKLELGSIMELFENKKIEISQSVKDNIQQGLKQYCELLNRAGKVQTCSDFGPDAAFPTKTGYMNTTSITFPQKLVNTKYDGDWGAEETCRFPHFANKMELKIEEPYTQGGMDKSPLNAIRLTCTDGSRITSSYQRWGGWWGVAACPAGTFIQKAILRRGVRDHPQDDEGESSTNGIRFKCTNIPYDIIPGDGYMGDWSEWESCEEGSAVYGIQTRVENTTKKDSTALNDVRFLCAKLSEREMPQFVQVTSSGEASTAQRATIGTYELQTNKINNHPVWKKADLYLFVNSDEVWAIGKDMNSTGGDLFLDKKPAPQLPGPGPWKFYDSEDSKWKQDETLTVDASTGIPLLRCNGMDQDCCTAENPCQEGDGVCDSDSECKGDLICGDYSCPWGGYDGSCQKGSTIRVASGQRLGYLSYDPDGKVKMNNEDKRQKWVFKHLFADVYNIIVVSGETTMESGKTFLSCTENGDVDLNRSDGGDRQKWRIQQVDLDTYNIKIYGGTKEGEVFLSCTEDGLVDLYSKEGTRQRWNLNLGAATI